MLKDNLEYVVKIDLHEVCSKYKFDYKIFISVDTCESDKEEVYMGYRITNVEIQINVVICNSKL